MVFVAVIVPALATNPAAPAPLVVISVPLRVAVPPFALTKTAKELAPEVVIEPPVMVIGLPAGFNVSSSVVICASTSTAGEFDPVVLMATLDRVA